MHSLEAQEEAAGIIRRDTPEKSARYRDLLRQIAYPKRGTEEELLDIYGAAKLIQDNFTLEDLSDD